MTAKDLETIIILHIQRGTAHSGPRMEEHQVAIEPGMVVLDAVLRLQETELPDLSVRWNCKAGRCGSCAAEINGKPSLMCMTKLSTLDLSKPILVRPMRSFPLIKDLVTDVSWNYEVNKRILPYQPPKTSDPRMMQFEVDRVQEFRKCIECFLCQDSCHVIRIHDMKAVYAGPRFFVRLASLEMHPLDTADRIPAIKEDFSIGLCNITKCCTEVCPEEIPITDEAIIALKERVADRYYDPVKWLVRKILPKKK